MDLQVMARVYVLFLALLAISATSGCAADGWDCVCMGGALPATHAINGQLLAELARDDK